jgi:hypothetical protein
LWVISFEWRGAVDIIGPNLDRALTLGDRLETLQLRSPDVPVDLTPLLDHPHIRTIEVSIGRLSDPSQVNRFPALEYLSAERRDWRRRLDANQVPTQLLAALVGSGHHSIDYDRKVVPIANEILTLWGSLRSKYTNSATETA